MLASQLPPSAHASQFGPAPAESLSAESLASLSFPTNTVVGTNCAFHEDVVSVILRRQSDQDANARNPDPLLAEPTEEGYFRPAETVPPAAAQPTPPNPSGTTPKQPHPANTLHGKRKTHQQHKSRPRAKAARQAAKVVSQEIKKQLKFHPSSGEQHQFPRPLDMQRLPIASTGWKGRPFPQGTASAIKDMISKGEHDQLYRGFTLVQFRDGDCPNQQPPTYIRDIKGRLVIWRSHLSIFTFQSLHQIYQFSLDVVKSCTPEPDILTHSRGRHWYCIAGHHRQSSGSVLLSKWHRENYAQFAPFLREDSILMRLTTFGCNCLRVQFPRIARRYQACIDYHAQHNQIRPMFGLFWNFCLNAPLPSSGAPRVHCDPHVDLQNIAVGVCMLFVYQGKVPFRHRETSWLVIWEAKVIVHLPPGVFLLYPSSLFYHWNVDVRDINLVTTLNGELPTPLNSEPLHRPEDGPDGRGSMVWFNQASMFQSSELNTTSIKALREKVASSSTTPDGFTVFSPAEEMIRDGFFSIF